VSRRGRRGRGGAARSRGGGERDETAAEGPQGGAQLGVLRDAGCILATAMLVDAAWSGDWSRIGAISVATEGKLKLLSGAVAAERLALVWFLSSENAAAGDPKTEKVGPWTLAKALLGGTLCVLSALKQAK